MNAGQKENNKMIRKESNIKKSGVWKFILELLPMVLLLLVLLIFYKKLTGVLIPLIFGGIIAYMAEPSVKFIYEKLSKRFKINRNVCVIAVFLFFLLLLIAFVSFVIPVVVSNITEIIENIDGIQNKITNYVKNLVSDNHPELKARISNIILEMSNRITEKGDALISRAASFSTYSKISQVLVGLVTTFVFAYYILRDKTLFKNWFLGIFPYRCRSFAAEIIQDIGSISAKFIKGQFAVALLVGIIEAVGLMLLGIPYSIFFGIIGGLSNMIPYFGPFIGGVLPVIAAFMISPFKALCVLVLFLGVQQIDNHFISPKVIEGNLGIHPVTVIAAILIGQELFGIIGILTAVPLYAILKCIFLKIASKISV